MQKSSTFLIFILLINNFCLASGIKPTTDSVAFTPTIRSDIFMSAGIGAGVLATSVIGRQSYSHSFAVDTRHKKSEHATGVLQFLPLATPWVLKASGIDTRSDWGRMAVSQGLAVAIMAGSVKVFKETVTSTRPDGSDTHSFPSGHTAWAFMGAAATAYELSSQSPWYPFGAYLLASGIGAERVIARHHYPTDVIAGAGIGILSTSIGYFIGDLIFGYRQIAPTQSIALSDANRPHISVATGLSLPLSSLRFGDTSLRQLPALTTSISGGIPVADSFGVDLGFGLLSTPYIFESPNAPATYINTLSSLTATLSPYYIHTLCNRVSLTASLGIGYRYNMRTSCDGRALNINRSSPMGNFKAGCIMKFCENFSSKISLGYEISHFRADLSPSDRFPISHSMTSSRALSSLLIEVSSRVKF